MRYSVSRHGRVGRLPERPAGDRRARPRADAAGPGRDPGRHVRPERWIAEADGGFGEFLRLRQQAQTSQLEQVGRQLRQMMPWLESEQEGATDMSDATIDRNGLRSEAMPATYHGRPDLRHDPARRGAGARHRAHPSREGRDRRAARPPRRRHPRGRGSRSRRRASSRRSARSPTTVRGPVIAALARTATGDIERAAEALKGADRWRIHTFISTSDIQMGAMLKMSNHQVLDAIRENVSLAKTYTDDVEFSAQDATRTELELPARVLPAGGAECGATTINVPDTVGYATPTEFGELIRIVRDGHARRRGHLDPLPQRPRAGGGERARRASSTAPAGRGGGERDRRARRQLLARGDRDDRAHARAAHLGVTARAQRQGDHAHVAARRA